MKPAFNKLGLYDIKIFQDKHLELLDRPTQSVNTKAQGTHNWLYHHAWNSTDATTPGKGLQCSTKQNDFDLPKLDSNTLLNTI